MIFFLKEWDLPGDSTVQGWESPTKSFNSKFSGSVILAVTSIN